MSNYSVYKKDKAPPKPGAKKGGRPKKGQIVVRELGEPGRPSKLEIDPDLIKKMRNAILLGAPIVTAAALNDISYETMREWVLKGKEDPSSEYGALIRQLQKAIVEWEIRDLSAWDAHIHGRPAQYLTQQVVVDGKPLTDPNTGRPVMEIVRDGEGNPVIQASEIRPDWRAAAERLARRKSKTWAKQINVDLDVVLTFDNKEREAKPAEAMSFEQRVAMAMKKWDEKI